MLINLRIAIFSVIAVFIFSCQSTSDLEIETQAPVRIAILSTTDVHGHILAWDYYQDEPNERYALSKASTIITSLRERYPNNILIDAGDWLQGNPFAEYPARIDTTGMHYGFLRAVDHMKYDAVVLGNHEFNFGLEYLNNQISMTETPIIGANIYDHGTKNPHYTPYVLREFDGITVGILGLTTPGSAIWDRPRVEGILDFGDGVEAAKRFVPEMYEAGADVVVVLAHSAFEGRNSFNADELGLENFGKAILDEVPGIHAMVLGHRHRVFSTVYQSPVTNQNVAVVEAGRWASHVGLITLSVERRGNGSFRVSPEITRNISVADASEDPAIVELVSEDHERVRAFVNTEVVSTNDSWETSYARQRPSAAVSLINAVQTEKTGAQLSAAAAFTTNLTLGPGSISIGDLAQLYPYENALYKMRITGEILRKYLEHTSRYWQTTTAGTSPRTDPSVPGFNYDMISGISYEIDLRREPGSRITMLQYQGNDIKDDDEFTIAINSYRAEGGGGFSMLKDAEIIQIIDRSVRDIITEYLSGKSNISKDDVFEDNWKLVY